ncbi:hypothetical protein O6H91_13G037200 [Diphasiastrum complanatum]|uniref:Uncharacterized protein n=1 Tax=Diphasiastrum complanatum TaxID=34168 RepID=A0ACC2BU80_DIPCM|nr:hypothetical protein O6H91_13G037200 [Diphasiastrum complanatum]
MAKALLPLRSSCSPLFSFCSPPPAAPSLRIPSFALLPPLLHVRHHHPEVLVHHCFLPLRSFPRLPLHRRAHGTRGSSDAVKNEKVLSIGFLGLGIMGTAMARNLIKSGHDVMVWNRTANKCEVLVSEGAKLGSSPEQVAGSCDITFAMLADPTAAEVAWGKGGAVFGLGPEKGYVDVSTVDEETSKAISERVKSSGALYLEAPVSGSKKPAEEGKLIFLTAGLVGYVGDKLLYERVCPLLNVMGKSRFYLGEVGNGATMKLIVNMLMGSMMASLSEGLVLGSKVGLDPRTIIEVISEGAISAPMFSLKGPTMLKGDYEPAFPLKHQQKDLHLALALAEKVAQSTPVAAAANELYKLAKSTGLGDKDFSAVIEAVKS